jgi:hypothetical protein
MYSVAVNILLSGKYLEIEKYEEVEFLSIIGGKME